MNAIHQVTTTPVRDELVGIIQGLIDHIEDLGDGCKGCTKADTGWCDPHLERQVQIDELEALDRKLWKARTDTEAITLVAGLDDPEVVELVARVHGLDERTAADWMAVAAAGAERVA